MEETTSINLETIAVEAKKHVVGRMGKCLPRSRPGLIPAKTIETHGRQMLDFPPQNVLRFDPDRRRT